MVGSGLYWVLAGPLIGWFSVLIPAQIQLSEPGLRLILATGIACLALGCWVMPADLQRAQHLFSRTDGWIFTLPIILVVADLYLTLLGLSKGNWELNPYVASAVAVGPWAIIPFTISYLALSEGLALLMLTIGQWLFGEKDTLRFMPYSLVCGAASFGPISNSALLFNPAMGIPPYILGVAGLATLATGIYIHFIRIANGFGQSFLGLWP